MTLKEKYKEETKRSPYVFDKKGKITENFSYTDGYVLWLEEQIENDDFAVGFAEWVYEKGLNIGFYFKEDIKKELLTMYKKEKEL